MDRFIKKIIKHVSIALLVLILLFLIPTVIKALYLAFESSVLVINDSIIQIVGIVSTITIAIILYNLERREFFRDKVREQIKILASLKAELTILSGLNTEIYGGDTTIGNLDWYRDKIFNNRIVDLIHPINRLSFENYTSIINSSICNRVDVAKLVRSLSYINDKIYTINQTIDKLRSEDTSGKKEPVTEETIARVNAIKFIIDEQITDLRKILAG